MLELSAPAWEIHLLIMLYREKRQAKVNLIFSPPSRRLGVYHLGRSPREG